MKNKRKLCLAPYVFLTFFLFSFTTYADTVTIWGEYHPPLNGAPGDTAPGFMIEIAEAIFKKNGHRINYVLGPRERGVQMVRSGKIDCVVNAKIKDHHFLSFPEQPWAYHAATLFAKPESSFKYHDISSLKNVKLGAISGMRYDNGPLDDYIGSKSANVSFAYGDDAMATQVMKLKANRIDVVVSCPLLMRGQLKSMDFPMQTFKAVGEVKPFVGMYLACGRGRERTEAFIAEIDKTIPQLRDSGELAHILDKYGQIDWISIYSVLKNHTNERF